MLLWWMLGRGLRLRRRLPGPTAPRSRRSAQSSRAAVARAQDDLKLANKRHDLDVKVLSRAFASMSLTRRPSLRRCRRPPPHYLAARRRQGGALECAHFVAECDFVPKAIAASGADRTFATDIYWRSCLTIPPHEMRNKCSEALNDCRNRSCLARDYGSARRALQPCRYG